MTKGLLYVAFGKHYDGLVARAIMYSRRFTTLPVCVLTNVKDRGMWWRKIEDVSFVVFDLPQDENRMIKTSMNKYTPFDMTLYLDCDSVIQRPGIERVFDLFVNGKEMVLNWFLRWCEGERVLRIYQRTMKTTGVGLPLNVYNGAFVAWKRCTITDIFFKTWAEMWTKMGSGRDMPALACAIKRSGVRVFDVTTQDDKFFAPDTPDTECVVQHNYNTVNGANFFDVFGLPRILENKPFDCAGSNSDWDMVDF